MRFSPNDSHPVIFTRNPHKKLFAKIRDGEFHAANFQEGFGTNFWTTSFLTNSVNKTRNSARRTVSLRVEQFREARILLQKREILIVARVITIFRTQLYGNFQILHR
jgi:hypothetical protein